MRKSRVTRELLNSFYNMEEGISTDNESSSNGEEDQIHEEGNSNNNNNNEHEREVPKHKELDKKDFDVDKYLTRVLATLPLCDLLREEQCLGSEARTLDGEMKTLVYQNYHKFVIATNTVDAMHRNVGTIEGELHKLRTDVSTAGECVSSISAGIDAKCARLRHLRSVEAHLSRLRFAAELPHKLEQCLAMGAYREAVDCYMRTAALFERSSSLPSFARISAECSSIVAELKKRLWAEIRVAGPSQVPQPDADRSAIAAFAHAFPGDRVADAAAMLIELGEPANGVREAFLDVSYSRVAFGAALNALSMSTTPAEVEASSNTFFGLLLQAHRGYMRSFHKKNKIAVIKNGENDSENNGNDDDDEVYSVDESIDVSDLRSTLSKGVDAYISCLQKWFTSYAQSGPSPLPLADTVAFLERLHARARQTAAILPHVVLVGHISCVVGDFLGLLVDRVFCDALDTAAASSVPLLREGCVTHAAPADDSGDSEFSQFWEGASERAAECVSSALGAAVTEVRVLIDTGVNKSFGDCIPDIVLRVHSEVQRFFFKLREKFAASVASYYNPVEEPFMPLLALALCGTVAKLFPVVDSVSSRVSEEFRLESDGITVIHVGEIHSMYSAFMKDLVDAFVGAESAALNAAVSSYVCELSTPHDGPSPYSSATLSHSPSPSPPEELDDLMQMIANVDACLSALFHVSEEDKSMMQNDGNGGGGGRKFYEVGGPRSSSDETECFSYEQILKRVAENVVRALSEYVRMHTYPENNTYAADRHIIGNALVGCYGCLSELSLILDKIELDVLQRTITEGDGENREGGGIW